MMTKNIEMSPLGADHAYRNGEPPSDSNSSSHDAGASNHHSEAFPIGSHSSSPLPPSMPSPPPYSPRDLPVPQTEANSAASPLPSFSANHTTTRPTLLSLIPFGLGGKNQEAPSGPQSGAETRVGDLENQTGAPLQHPQPEGPQPSQGPSATPGQARSQGTPVAQRRREQSSTCLCIYYILGGLVLLMLLTVLVCGILVGADFKPLRAILNEWLEKPAHTKVVNVVF